MIRIAIFAFLVLLHLISCDTKEEVRLGPKEIKLTGEQVEIIEGSNRFGLELFSEILALEDTGENIFISPLSVHLALSMAWNGAGGTTRDQMREVLAYPAVSDEVINNSIKKLIADLLSVDKRVETGIANSIWYRNDYSVLPEFLKVNSEFFDARISPLDFNNPASPDIINAWVAEMTKNRIDRIVDRIDQDHIMFLINAIYFKGIWTTEFVKDNTRERAFYLIGGQSRDVMTMETEGGFSYAERDGYKVAELPYGQGNYSMLVFLPDEETGIDAMAEKLNSGEWDRLPGLLENKLNIRLPRFSLEYETILNPALHNLGMTDAFSRYANFTRINPEGGLYISRVRHKSFVEVNEEGTEAAAVTSVEIRVVSHNPDEPRIIQFHVNRPFVFAIKEKYTNSVIFIGRVMEP
jgi:serine protease inhibitor